MAASYVSNYPQLLRTLATDQKIVYLCGAGASMSLANHRMSWPNWILAGKDYLDDADQLELDRRIGTWTTDELISAVTFLLDELKATGSYESFMTSTIGSQHPVNETFKDALRKVWRAGDLIATTNYDLTIEEAIDTESVSYSSPAGILAVIRGGDNRVIHLHGVYDKLHGKDDIVADDPQYKGILANAGAQFIQNLISTHPIIIVGCGGTVEDPNLSGFMSFVVEKLRVTDIPYFYLMKKGDSVPSLPANAIPVFYGDDYTDLPVFLSELSMLRLKRRACLKRLASINPYSQKEKAVSAFGRLHFSNAFSEFVGRSDSIRSLNEFLTEEKRFSWWTVLGDGGIGKSRLVLEWLRSIPSHWFGFFAYKKPDEARAFIPFTDTVIVFDYVLGRESETANTLAAYLDAFEVSPCKLRILFIERNQGTGDSDWLNKISRGLETEHRVEFEAARFKPPLEIKELSATDEITYVKNYLRVYLPLIPATDFVETCKTEIDEKSREIEEAFRSSVASSCYRPLYLSIFIEVWISKEGKLSLNSIEELLSEFLNKEKNRWRLILADDELVDSYLRLLAMACAIGYFNITDVYGDNYLEKDVKKLTEFFDDQSGKPGVGNTFTDLFVHMDELVDDDGEDSIAEAFAHPEAVRGRMDEEDVTPILSLDNDERFAYFAPYIKLYADPAEVYLQMMANVGAAEAEELEELQRVREERIRRVEALPDHAWVIVPEFPDIIKEYIVAYTVNDRDISRFTKLARSNSILGLSDFITRALEDWNEKQIFQRMAVTPPAEMLNYFEYYVSLLISLYQVDDLKTVEQALIDSDPCFLKYELELWRRISIVLTERGDMDRLFDSGCRFVEYLKSITGMVKIRDEAAEVINEYCAGLHNAGEFEKHSAFLKLCDEVAQENPENQRVGEVLCENYHYLVNAKVYGHKIDDAELEWYASEQLLHRYQYPEAMCTTAMETAHDYMLILLKQNALDKLEVLEQSIESIYEKAKFEKVAEVSALCAANMYTNAYRLKNKPPSDELAKIKGYLHDYPTSKHIRSAYISALRASYLETASYRKVPDNLLNQAKEWSLQYPDDIEFPEGYFGLLMARLEYAQAHDQRNEQRRLFREMKTVAQRTDYSEYGETNDMEQSINMLECIYGYY